MTDSIADNIDFLGNAPYVVVALLAMGALYSMLTQKNLIKICVSTAILWSSINMFLILLGYRRVEAQESIMLPTPQFLTLTGIVTAMAATALMLSLAILINKHYGTLDIDEIRRLKG